MVDSMHKEAGMDEAPMLICYDGSAEAKHAIASAAELLGGRRAVVLDVAPFLTPAESLATLASAPVAFEDSNRSVAVTAAEDGARYARAAGLAAEPRAEVAAPTWEGILDVADQIDAAVIVMGTRGLDGAHELFEGSISHQVVEHASRPVLVVGSPHPAQ
jgi:nucleotide-binding universal stress UspA family protein